MKSFTFKFYQKQKVKLEKVISKDNIEDAWEEADKTLGKHPKWDEWECVSSFINK